VVLGNLPFLLSDTVGFIRKLPHQLIESFKSTLDETRESDILVHVVDISHSGFEDQMRVVNDTLQEIGAGHKPMILVFNKIDALHFHPAGQAEDENEDESPVPRSLDELRQTWMARISDKTIVFISAQERQNLEELREVLYERVKAIHEERYPYNNFLY
jgi:GTP-binding protein HflX